MIELDFFLCTSAYFQFITALPDRPDRILLRGGGAHQRRSIIEIPLTGRFYLILFRVRVSFLGKCCHDIL